MHIPTLTLFSITSRTLCYMLYIIYNNYAHTRSYVGTTHVNPTLSQINNNNPVIFDALQYH